MAEIKNHSYLDALNHEIQRDPRKVMYQYGMFFLGQTSELLRHFNSPNELVQSATDRIQGELNRITQTTKRRNVDITEPASSIYNYHGISLLRKPSKGVQIQFKNESSNLTQILEDSYDVSETPPVPLPYINMFIISEHLKGEPTLRSALQIPLDPTSNIPMRLWFNKALVPRDGVVYCSENLITEKQVNTMHEYINLIHHIKNKVRFVFQG